MHVTRQFVFVRRRVKSSDCSVLGLPSTTFHTAHSICWVQYKSRIEECAPADGVDVEWSGTSSFGGAELGLADGSAEALLTISSVEPALAHESMRTRPIVLP